MTDTNELRNNAVKRAAEIVSTSEWSGDLRVNLTTVIGAGRVLLKRLAEQSDELDALRAELTEAKRGWEYMTKDANEIRLAIQAAQLVTQNLNGKLVIVPTSDEWAKREWEKLEAELATAKADAERYREVMRHVADGLDPQLNTMAISCGVRLLREALNPKESP